MRRVDLRARALALTFVAGLWPAAAYAQDIMMILVKVGCTFDPSSSPICLDVRLQSKADTLFREMMARAEKDPAAKATIWQELEGVADKVLACKKDEGCIDDALGGSDGAGSTVTAETHTAPGLGIPPPPKKLTPEDIFGGGPEGAQAQRDALAGIPKAPGIPPPPTNVVPTSPLGEGGMQAFVDALTGGGGSGRPADEKNANRQEAMAAMELFHACNGDRDCQERAITGKAPKPRPEEKVVSDEEIAREIAEAYEAAFNKRRAELEAEERARIAQVAEERRAREVFDADLAQIISDYAVRWQPLHDRLQHYSPEAEKFTDLFAAPDELRSRLEEKCGGRSACLRVEGRKVFGTVIGLESHGERLYKSAQSRLQAEKAARDEIRRREEAVKRAARLANLQKKLREEPRDLAPNLVAFDSIRIDSVFPEGSLLRLVVLGEFDELDEILKSVMDDKYGQDFEAVAGLFSAEGMGRDARAGVLERRRELFAQAYILTRMKVLKTCGEPSEDVKTGFIPEQTSYSQLPGRILATTTPGRDTYTRVPVRFVPFIRGTLVAARDDFFSKEVRAMAGCAHPARQILEANIIRFAQHQNFLQWHAEDMFEGQMEPARMQDIDAEEVVIASRLE